VKEPRYEEELFGPTTAFVLGPELKEIFPDIHPK
jgi:hypothetical protein